MIRMQMPSGKWIETDGNVDKAHITEILESGKGTMSDDELIAVLCRMISVHRKFDECATALKIASHFCTLLYSYILIQPDNVAKHGKECYATLNREQRIAVHCAITNTDETLEHLQEIVSSVMCEPQPDLEDDPVIGKLSEEEKPKIAARLMQNLTDALADTYMASAMREKSKDPVASLE